MDDLEIVRRCAEKMGLKKGIDYYEHRRDNMDEYPIEITQLYLTTNPEKEYDPLTDDGQAMALVKRFKISIGALSNGWKVFAKVGNNFVDADDKDLNRAICLCASNLPESGKPPKPQSSAPA